MTDLNGGLMCHLSRNLPSPWYRETENRGSDRQRPKNTEKDRGAQENIIFISYLE